MGEKVVLVHTNQLKEPPVAPIGLDYLADSLKRNGFEVDILDLCLADDFKEEINGFFSHSEVFAVGINLRNLNNMSIASPEFFMPRFKEIVELIKGKTSAPMILGGGAFSIIPEAVLDYCDLDLGICGEGEYSFPLLLSKIKRKENDFSDVPGLVYRAEKGFCRNPTEFFDLSKMPAPKRDRVDNKRYFLESGVGGVECRRSCSKHCIYCPDPWLKGEKLRFRSLDSVVDEIENLLRQGIDHIYFVDSEFNVPNESYARMLCQRIIERGLGSKIRWSADAIPVPFSEELASLFLKAGCESVAFNIDVFSERMLRNMGRDFTVEDIKKTASICHRQGLPFVYYLLLGGPGETKDTLRETVENVKWASPEGTITVLGIAIVPGTKLAETVKNEGPLNKNPNLQREVEGNDNFFAPVFYMSSALGSREEAREYIANLIGKDERFFFRKKEKEESPANPGTANIILSKALNAGYRGMYWDILRKVKKDGFLEKWLKE